MEDNIMSVLCFGRGRIYKFGKGVDLCRTDICAHFRGFIPRRIFHILGITDDALAVGYVIVKIKDKITPQIELKIAMQLDKWFGYEITQVDEQ